MSGTPHMTGRRKADSNDETRSAADLLNDDGTVDISAVREINQAGGYADSPTAAEVTEMRQRLIRGDTYRNVAAAMDWGDETVRKYARGDKEVDGDEPACPPVEYRDGEWWVVDDE